MAVFSHPSAENNSVMGNTFIMSHKITKNIREDIRGILKKKPYRIDIHNIFTNFANY